MKKKKSISFLFFPLIPVMLFITFAFEGTVAVSQIPLNDNCTNAYLLCANVQLPANNINATAQCGGGADGDCGLGTWCFTVENSVWFLFSTNDIGGKCTLSVSNFSGAMDAVLLSAATGCSPAGYTILDCKNNQQSSMALIPTVDLDPNSVYWVMVDGASGNQTNFQIAVFGEAVQWDVEKTITDATCDNSCDGSATVTPKDGTSPYSYQWTPGGCTTPTCTGLCSGTYFVTVSDSIGCGTLITLTIDTLPPATVSVTSSDEQCLNSCNGTATATLSFGQTPYSYAWNTVPSQTDQTATGLCSGLVSVTVTDNLGCDTTASLIMGTLPPATVSVSFTDAQCDCTGPVGSGTATAILSSGPSPHVYIWNTSPVQTTQTATGLCPGNYSVTVTDSVGCDTSDSVTINIDHTAVVTVEKTEPCSPACSSTATASLSVGILPYTYLWSDGQTSNPATGLCNGTYSVTVIDSVGCDTIGSVIISQPSEISAVSVTTTDVKCGNLGSATAVVTGGTSPYSYLWSNNSASDYIFGLNPGTYSVTVTDINDCSGTSEGAVAEVECDYEIKPANKFSPNGDGINDIWIISNVDKYPDCKVMVYNRWGQRVYSATGYNNNEVVWDGNLVPDAIYFYVIYYDKKNKKDKEGVLIGNVTILR